MEGDIGYRMVVPDVNLFTVHDQLAIPAIAIPVERGKTFECRSDLLSHLQTLLPAVSHVLVIGWRGMEQHFLEFLRGSMKQVVRILVVSGKRQGGEEIASRLLGTSHAPGPLRGVHQIFAGGFSEFVKSREVYNFLRR
jgi:hypothetical protein